jgi:hypothetical protein
VEASPALAGRVRPVATGGRGAAKEEWICHRGIYILTFSMAVFETECRNLRQSVSGAYSDDLDMSDVERVGACVGHKSKLNGHVPSPGVRY